MHLARFLHDMRSPEGSRGIKEIDPDPPDPVKTLWDAYPASPMEPYEWKKSAPYPWRALWRLMNQNDWMHHIRWQFYGTLWRKSCLCASIFNAFFSGALCAHSSAKAPPLTAKPHPSGKLLTPAANSTPAANLNSSGKLPKLSILISTYKYLARNLPKF